MNAQLETDLLESLSFDNRFIKELPADPVTDNYCRQVTDSSYSRVTPKQAANPKLIAYSEEVAKLLDLDEQTCKSGLFTEIFVGNKLLANMDAYATCYGGHQFGHWAGQLGDGRAINLGEIVNQQGQRWALQLKGAGLTPYSRTADGLAVLRSSAREFLCSEAMFHLGVPTTRALSIIGTGEQVIRDMFYDGNPRPEPGAVVCRVAPSFIRFGNFQIHAARGENGLLKQLLNYTIRTDFPHLGEPNKQAYLAWFQEICTRTAEMIVHWQRVGFVHGVMNTDNMSILGLTIDYGPYGWLENFDPDWTPNTTDAQERRYRFGHQPQIAYWNLGQLANAIFPIIGQAPPLQEALALYPQHFNNGWQRMMADKLGLKEFRPETDETLFSELMLILQHVETDMTIFFRKLGLLDTGKIKTVEAFIILLEDAYYLPEQINAEYKSKLERWFKNYTKRLQSDGQSFNNRKRQMQAVNPKYVLRNYLAQLAIDKAEQGDYSGINELLNVLRTPYDEQSDKEKFAQKRPDWARHRAGCSMLSCSS